MRRDVILQPDWQQPERGICDKDGRITDPVVREDYRRFHERLWTLQRDAHYEELAATARGDAAAMLRARRQAAELASRDVAVQLDSFDWERHRDAVRDGSEHGRIRMVDNEASDPAERRRFDEDPDLAWQARTEPSYASHNGRLGRSTQPRFSEVGRGDRSLDGNGARGALALPRLAPENPHHGGPGADGADVLIAYRADPAHRGRQVAIVDEIAGGRWRFSEREGDDGPVRHSMQYWPGGGRQAVILRGADAYEAERGATGGIKVWDRIAGAEREVPEFRMPDPPVPVKATPDLASDNDAPRPARAPERPRGWRPEIVGREP